MNALVTGANGFIGSNLCASLIKRGDTVVGLVRPESDLTFLNDLSELKVVTGDIAQKQTLVTAMQNTRIVYHVAGCAVDWGPWETFRLVNVAGVQNVMEAALQCGVKRVVHLSSVSVYGFAGGINIDENHPLVARPDDPYITTKTEGEKLALGYNSDQLEVTVIRPAGVYGPNDRTTTLQIAPVLLSRQFGYVDGGKHIMAPVYIDNLIQLMHQAAESDAAPGQVYNAVDDGLTTWKEYIEGMCDELDCKYPWLSVARWIAWPLAVMIDYTAKRFNKKESPMINKYRVRAVMKDHHYSTEKAKRDLGYQPMVSTREGIKKTIQWFSEYSNSKRD